MTQRPLPALVFVSAVLGFLAGRATSAPQEPASGLQDGEMPVPGRMHRLLDPLEGSFHAAGTLAVPGQAEPLAFEGRAEERWTCNGFFLRQDLTAELAGRSLVGLGLLGWSEVDQAFQSLWIDGLSGEMFFKTAGELLEDEKTIVNVGEEADARSGKKIRVKDVLVVEDASRHTFRKFQVDAEGNELQTLEIVYTRE